MPRQRIQHSRRTDDFPDDFPQRLVRFQEESGLPWAEPNRRLDTGPETVRRWRDKGVGPARGTCWRCWSWLRTRASATFHRVTHRRACIGSSGGFISSPRLGAGPLLPPSLSGGIRANRGNYAILLHLEVECSSIHRKRAQADRIANLSLGGPFIRRRATHLYRHPIASDPPDWRLPLVATRRKPIAVATTVQAALSLKPFRHGKTGHRHLPTVQPSTIKATLHPGLPYGPCGSRRGGGVKMYAGSPASSPSLRRSRLITDRSGRRSS